MHQNGSASSAPNEIFNNQHNKISQLTNLETKSFKPKNGIKKEAKHKK